MPQAPNKPFLSLFTGSQPKATMVDSDVSNTANPAVSASSKELLRDVPPQGAHNRVLSRLTRVPIIGFLTTFVRDVFLKAENIPYYVVLVIPVIESSVWGVFNPLMQNDQFQYSKQAQADWAFPMQIITFVLITPFAGWYSDVRVRIRMWVRLVMLCASAAALLSVLWVLRNYSPANIREVPSFAVLLSVTALTAASMVLFYIPTVETMLDGVGRENARAWVSLLTVVKAIVYVLLLYIVILRSADQVPHIMIWMVFSVIGATLGTLMDTFIGPMVYDYMPHSQMGTINSGRGMIDSIVSVASANIGAWWVIFFTAHIHKPSHVQYDYTSIYILQFFCLIPALWAKVYFIRLISSGRLKKWGVMEVEEPEQAVREERIAHVL